MRKIVKLPSDVLVEPPPVAAVPLTVSAPPVGAVESSTNVRPCIAELPALSAPVSVYPLGVDGLALQLKVEEMYGDAPFTVSFPCVQPVVAVAGNCTDAAPEPPVSESGCESVKLPVTPLRKYTVVPVTAALAGEPIASVPKVGAAVSYVKVRVIVAAVLPTLSIARREIV